MNTTFNWLQNNLALMGFIPAPAQQIEQHPAGAGFTPARMVDDTWKSLISGTINKITEGIKRCQYSPKQR
jgi:hypothetical protein